MKKFLISIACLAATVVMALAAAGRADAQGGLRIAAVVNEDVISLHDLENRMALALVTSNLEDRPEVRQRIAPQILRSLIDDRLKVQEARRLNVVVTQNEINDALERIARQVNMPASEIPRFLASRGVKMSTLIEQIEAELAWLKTVNRLEGNRVQVGEDEIDTELNRMRQNAGQPEYRIADIFLPIDDPADEPRVRQLAERLLVQLREGARFPALARNFSQAASAAVGGDLGWVRRGQLPSQLDAVLPELEPGEVSAPIRTPVGFYLILMIDKRTSQGLAEGNVSEQRALVERALREESLTAASQRHLRDLRRSALIDIRI